MSVSSSVAAATDPDPPAPLSLLSPPREGLLPPPPLTLSIGLRLPPPIPPPPRDMPRWVLELEFLGALPIPRPP